MTMLTTKSIGQILARKFPRLGNIGEKTKELQHLNQIFQATLDMDLTKHCQIATLEQEKMVVIVDNAAWATRLRYAIPDIIKTLQIQPEFKKLQNIRYRIVRAIHESPLRELPSKNPAAQQHAQDLNNIAKNLIK